MATSKPSTLQVSDIIKWYRDRELVINDTFQRHSVWTSAAKTYFIDTVLHELPIPKIFIRTKINPRSQQSIREVVDGQQRVKTLVEFASNELTLTKRSEDFQGMTYADLDTDQQHIFLSYTLTVEQLLNASNDDVIDIFARLNSYTVQLNAAEKRHAKYQTVFKFAVRKATKTFRWFIEKYNVFSTKKRFRMADDVFFADVYSVLLEGVCDGGERYLNKFYERMTDEEFTESVQAKCESKIGAGFKFLDEKLGDSLSGHFSRHYQLLMLLAAFFHHQYGIPEGEIEEMPPREKLASPTTIRDRLADIESALDTENPPKRWRQFVKASSARPERIASRSVRFQTLCNAFAT